MKKKYFFLLVIFGSYIHIYCGAQNKVLLDKILATVGSKIILRSDISNQVADLKRQGAAVTDSTECLLLEQEIIKKIMVLQAEKDSLLVSEEEIESEIDNRIKYFISVYGGKNELEQIAGKDIYKLKEYFKNPIQEGLLARNMQRKIIENVRVTPVEVKNYFEKIPSDSLPFWESEFQIGQLVMYAKASKEDEEHAIETLKEIKSKIESGATRFEVQAQLYTDDPGSKNTGGKYELNKNEKQWDPVFLATAFRLKEGQISDVIRSKYGYHIIQLVSRFGDDAVVRHILKIPPILDQDIEPVFKLIDSVRNLLILNKISYSQAVATYNEDDNSNFTAGFLMGHSQNTNLTIDEIDKDLIPILDSLKVGEYSKPFVFKDVRGRVGVKMVYLKNKTEPHRENLQDDYLKISQRLIEKKKMETVDSWIESKVSNFYLELDNAYKNCGSNIVRWKKKSDTISF